MAIAASYTMHLYCDCRQCTEGVYPVPDFGEYIGTVMVWLCKRGA